MLDESRNVEYGVFRTDTGKQVGVGTTDEKERALEDLRAWTNEGWNVELKMRSVGAWEKPRQM